MSESRHDGPISAASAQPDDTGLWNRVAERLGAYGRLMRVDRPIGTLLLLWPALWALWLSSAGRPSSAVFLVFVLGVFLMRSAGCVINDFADRKIDPHVRRTMDRPMATGEVSVVEALTLFVVLSLTALALVLTLDRMTTMLAVVGFGLAVLYPFTKRFTSVPQFVLGAAFGWSVPMAWAAHTGALPPVAWVVYFAVIVWAAAYDTMYAMVDRADDLRIGVKSTAILFGDADRTVIAVMQAMTLVAMALAGGLLDLGGWYFAGLVGAGGYALWQQVLIHDREPARCFRAFLSNNGFGATIFAGILLHYTFA